MDSSVAVILLASSSSLSNLFIYCYFGKLATESFEQMSDCLYYDFVWHNLPNKLQKYLVVMIANMQKPIFYRGFHFAVLNLNTFIQVRFKKAAKQLHGVFLCVYNDLYFFSYSGMSSMAL